MKITTGLDTDGPIDRTIARASELRDLGFDELWASQIFGPDTLTVLALVGRELPTLNFGTAIIPIHPRHPAMLAAQARTVEQAIGGHLSLGIGLSHKVVVEGLWGISFDKPAQYMAEYLNAIGPMLEGETVNVHGERVSAVSLSPVGPKEVRAPSLLVAALGPAMLKLAGTLTDGTVLWMTGPKTVSSHIAPVINEAAAAAGRPAPRIICSLPVTVTNDVAAARQRANETFAVYATLPSYAAMMAHEGATEPADLALIGSREQVTDLIGQIAATGATEFSGNVSGVAQEREESLALLSQLARS